MGRQSASQSVPPIHETDAAANETSGRAPVNGCPGRRNDPAPNELIGGIAHDCNNLLGGILAHSELILSEPLAAGSKEAAERIKLLALQTSEIVRELLVHAGLEESVCKPLVLSELAGEITHLLRVLVPKNVSIRTGFARGLAPAMVNAPRFRRAIMNLVLNASEAIGDQRGTIRIETRTLLARHNSVLPGGAHLGPGDYVVLSVSDTGPGMDEWTRRRAFGNLFTTKAAGRGLGLGVVRQVVKEHKGVLGFESSPGKGSCFSVFLPSLGKPVRIAPAINPKAIRNPLAPKGAPYQSISLRSSSFSGNPKN